MTKRALDRRMAPDIDKQLHMAAVFAADELNKIYQKKEVSNNEVIKAKELVTLLLLCKKNGKPLQKKEKVEPTDPSSGNAPADPLD